MSASGKNSYKYSVSYFRQKRSISDVWVGYWYSSEAVSRKLFYSPDLLSLNSFAMEVPII